MSDKGYLPLNRKIFEHELWKEKRSFSKFEAWLDLLALANYDDKEKTKLIGLKIIKWARGQLPASIRFLQERWNWASTKRVKTFLDMLLKENMIRIEKETGQNVITICNYDTYNGKIVNGKREGNARETPGKREGNKTNKDNKDNNLFILPDDVGEDSSTDKDVSDFDKFWNLYDKKEGRKKCEIAWNALPKYKQELALANVEAYVKSTPDKQYRKNPLTYIHGECWNDELRIRGDTPSPKPIQEAPIAKKLSEEDVYSMVGLTNMPEKKYTPSFKLSS